MTLGFKRKQPETIDLETLEMVEAMKLINNEKEAEKITADIN